MQRVVGNTQPTIQDLDITQFGYCVTVPAELWQVAAIYEAGGIRRLEEESENWWGKHDLTALALKYQQSGDLIVRTTHLDEPAFERSAAGNIYSNPYKPIVATAVITKDAHHDIELWSEVSDITDSIHIHRLATHPNFYGQRHGEALIASIAFGSHYQRHDRPYIRLDCAAEATKLRQYYEQRIGMACVGEAIRSSGYHAALYEAPISQLFPAHWLSSAVQQAA